MTTPLYRIKEMTMAHTHTPGPWQYAFEGGTAAYIVESDGTTVAKLSVAANSTAHSSFAANARLMALAPSLLAALYAVYALRPIGSGADGYALAVEGIARAAIAKATGESA